MGVLVVLPKKRAKLVKPKFVDDESSSDDDDASIGGSSTDSSDSSDSCMDEPCKRRRTKKGVNGVKNVNNKLKESMEKLKAKYRERYRTRYETMTVAIKNQQPAHVPAPSPAHVPAPEVKQKRSRRDFDFEDRGRTPEDMLQKALKEILKM
jgi:hypothetical protein